MQDLKNGFNYGLYCPSVGGKAGKFLDEERPLKDYPLAGPVGYLEVSSSYGMTSYVIPMFVWYTYDHTMLASILFGKI